MSERRTSSIGVATCAARPPAPQQQGMAPNQAPAAFMAPMASDSAAGLAPRPGNSSPDSWLAEMTEFSVVSGSCGSPARRMPARADADAGAGYAPAAALRQSHYGTASHGGGAPT